MPDPSDPRSEQQKADAEADVNVARSGDGKTVITWPRRDNEEI